MVEIDAGVVEFSRQYLPKLSNGAFEDPRLDLVINDGAVFMRETERRFDVIIVDSTDPIGPGEVLFTDHFYGHAKRALNPGGILGDTERRPLHAAFRADGHDAAPFKSLFADWGCYIANIPTYAGGLWPSAGVRMAIARRFRSRPLRARFAAAGITPDYYTPEVHKAAFALPAYIERLLPR